ncbi:S8 family serine peptidase [Lipingzhangella sp. LS1_29]|uniref:S8 family serine peptidase n=1 Tax=Lipingzhangella rawalii TaxID=2055835 RepID=A0ABU2H5U6_9ACTN|nr:S8 family serine peptidase [Lipingzhangella rawalii]MDS1270225.1 S8 family serine peptidase [Lipingzhangella rawalii]
MSTRRAPQFGIIAVLAVLTGATAPAVANADVDHSDLSRDQWAHELLDLEEAWEHGRGTGARVALLDTGVDQTHPDLDSAIVDEVDVTGQDLDPDTAPLGRHGTLMAGLVAARGHGEEHAGGVLGAAPEAGILSVRTTTAQDGSAESAEQDWVVSGIERAVSENAQVILLTGPATGSEAEREAIAEAHNRGVFVVVPGDGPHVATPNALSVNAVDEQQQLVSPEGATPNAEASLAAPGQDVLTTDPDGGFTEASGTTAASALAAGVAALIRAEYPQLRPDDVAEALQDGTTSPPANDEASDTGYGSGVLNAAAALEAAADSAEDVPPFDPSLAEEDTEDSPWLFWATVAAGAAFIVLAALLVFRLARGRRGGTRRARRR